MADKRDICERLEDQSIDGAIFLRRNAAKEIRALRHYVAQLEHDLVEEEHQHAKTIIKLENAREHIFDQALDIATLGQEVGRLREALLGATAALTAAISLLERSPSSKRSAPSDKMFEVMLSDYRRYAEQARAALAETEDK